MPVRVNAQQFADKLIRRGQQATEDMRLGVQNVSQSPTEQAAAAQDKWLAGIQEAAREGKWQAGLRRVTLQQWKDAMINKGLTRYGPGLDASRAKIEDFASDLIPYENNLLNTIESMPDLTLEDSIARATAWMRGMAQFRRGR